MIGIPNHKRNNKEDTKHCNNTFETDNSMIVFYRLECTYVLLLRTVYKLLRCVNTGSTLKHHTSSYSICSYDSIILFNKKNNIKWQNEKLLTYGL